MSTVYSSLFSNKQRLSSNSLIQNTQNMHKEQKYQPKISTFSSSSSSSSNEMNQHKQSDKKLLEPISSMCRIISLNFMQLNTKICIKDHAITFNKPHNYQCVVRYYSGNGRDDIGDLFIVIYRLISWYIIPLHKLCNGEKNYNSESNISIQNNNTQYDTQYDDTQNEYIKYEMQNDEIQNDEIQNNKIQNIDNDTNINEKQQQLKTLKTESSEIIDKPNVCIDMILSNNIDHNIIIEFNEKFIKLTRYMIMGLSTLQHTYNCGNVVFTLQYYINLLNDSINGKFNENMLPKCIFEQEYKHLLDYNKIIKMWDTKRIDNISDLFDHCYLTQNDTNESFSVRIKTINCYLKTIESILDPIDEEFRTMLIHSSLF